MAFVEFVIALFILFIYLIWFQMLGLDTRFMSWGLFGTFILGAFMLVDSFRNLIKSNVGAYDIGMSLLFGMLAFCIIYAGYNILILRS